MSVAGILDPVAGTIRAEYLPSAPTPHPYIENPFQSAVDGGNQTMTNVASLQLGASGAIPVGLTLNVDGNAGVVGKLGIGSLANGKQIWEPSSGTNNLEIDVPSGALVVDCPSGLIVGNQSATNSGTATIQIKNNTASATPTYYETYCAGASGGGLTAGHLQTFGYAGANIREIMDATSDGASIGLGDFSTVGGCVVSVQGSLGAGRVYDTVYNKPDDTKVLQIPGTLATLVVPPTGGANPAKTLATLDVSSLGSFNSFTVYLKLNTGNMTTPDGTAYNYQYFLSAGLDGNLDETKGCLVGYTGPLLNGQSDFLPNTTLLYRSATPINTLYLNVQVQIGQVHSGSTWTNPTWTADVYCSNI